MGIPYIILCEKKYMGNVDFGEIFLRDFPGESLLSNIFTCIAKLDALKKNDIFFSQKQVKNAHFHNLPKKLKIEPKKSKIAEILEIQSTSIHHIYMEGQAVGKCF
jgi:hypothetical protein